MGTKTQKKDDIQPALSNHVPVCAIGASAGGVTALRRLFQELPDDLGLAYVVILHLAPEHPSAMAEILSTCTKMKVHQVDKSPRLQQNCVYVIPPDRELVISGNSITAREFTAPRGKRAPIDMFFRSVAEARGDGMAVVLTGAGADGSNGLRAIEEAGGVVFVQDPDEAEFPAMPRNAIATGVVSFVAPICRLAGQIAEVARSKEAVRSLDEDGLANDLRKLIGFLRARTGHDFSNYKRATVMRRVLRRMQVCRVTEMSAYSELLNGSPEEAQELFRDLLISVTHFFRDEQCFETLQTKVIAPLFDKIPGDGIRVWSVGCATGEEAYSLAILMLEEAARRNVRVPIQIFASDLDDGALATAREGRYPRSIEADVSDERLHRFFVDEGTHYRIRKEVRELVLFPYHSALKDPPFLRLDLIACRNLLIYLERTVQEQLLGMFHYGLRTGGALFLGTAENADALPHLYRVVDRDTRIYSALPSTGRRKPAMPLLSLEQDAASRPSEQGHVRQKMPSLMHASALERGAPPSILVDAAQNIVHMSPGAGRFILHSGGTFTTRLADVVRPELRLDLGLALDKALGRKLPTLTLAAKVAFDGGARRIALHVLPVSSDNHVGDQVLVMFIDAGPSPDEPDDDLSITGEADIRRVLGELRAAQEALATSRGEQETALEDLRASNEELQSINEEYRSTSEELETSKEELQSLNEELQTVNAELKSKLESTSSAHSDLQNLISATDIGTLFLDTNLRIRMFTPSISDIFAITDMDTGRAITDFTSRLVYDKLEDDARKVLHDLMPVETEVEGRNGRWFIIRLRPYRTIEDRIEGVVLTFVDISSRRRIESDLRESQQNYQVLFDSIDEGFAIIKVIFEDDIPVDYRFIKVNSSFERQTGLANASGRSVREMVPDIEDHWPQRFGQVAISGKPERFEAPSHVMGRYFDGYAFPVGLKGEQLVGILFRDVTERKEAEHQRQMLTDELSHRVKNTLAVVQALARQPGSAQMTVEQYRDRFVGRIQALGHAHDQLLETHWKSADLEMLARRALSAYGGQGRRELELSGPEILLTPKQGLGLALVLHELATNASKYGSLSTESGALSLTWEISSSEGGQKVNLLWRETGGPKVEVAETHGFGTRLITQACTYELDGSVELSPLETGYLAKISFPIDWIGHG
jgi:two-component system CheB/CheR fusion protein